MDQRLDDVDSNFDALIDLLASDDVQNIAAAGPSLDSSHSSGHTARLRDASGKLDFDKIHLMFAKRNLGADDTDQSRRLARETDPQDVLDRRGLSRSVSPSRQPRDPQQGLRVPSSDSPASLDRDVENRRQQTPQSPKPISESHFRFSSGSTGSYEGNGLLQRNPPTSQTLIVNPVSCNPVQHPHQGSSTGKVATKPTPTLDKREIQDLIAPLQFGQMNDTLSRATSEVGALREQYEKLRALVAERLHPSKNCHAGKPSAQPSGNHVIFPSQAQVSIADPSLCPHSDDDISSLSEYEAKEVLARLVTSLRLSPHLIKNMLSEDPDTSLSSLFPSPNDVQDIKSSMEFLGSVDELVWKRSMPVNGGEPDPLYSRANMDALMQRLLLWERSVRGPHKR